MNKAFTREDDAPPDDEDDVEAGPPLPIGTRNYMTPGGFARLKVELDALVGTERPALVATVAWAASNGDRSENGDYLYGKKRLREIDRRIRFLVKRLDAAEVVDPEVARARRHRPGLLRRDRRLRDARGGQAHDQHRRHRRDRHRARLRVVDLAGRARAHQGPRGRRRAAAHAGRLRRARGAGRALRPARHRRGAGRGRRARLTLARVYPHHSPVDNDWRSSSRSSPP
jgi:hypothetical protein